MLKKNKYQDVCSQRDRTGLSILSICVVSNAPRHILDKIIEIDPSQLHRPDSFGATPLHIACLNGANPDYIQYLVDRDSDLVSAKDIDRRVPLHHAVECICRNDITFNQGKAVIRILSDANCHMIHSNDRNSHSPLDIAQIARTMAPVKDGCVLKKLYDFLSNISVNVYLHKKAMWERQPHHGASGKSISTDGTTLSSQSAPGTNDDGILAASSKNNDEVDDLVSSKEYLTSGAIHEKITVTGSTEESSIRING
jgi:hypothetical protein